jgi:hypothetical protein
MYVLSQINTDFIYINLLLTTYIKAIMNQFLQFPLKISAFNFLKLSSIVLAILLSYGVYSRANAESKSEVEVLSVPPQEAYYVEDKNQSNSSSDRSNLQNEQNSGKRNRQVPDFMERGGNANTANSAPNTLDRRTPQQTHNKIKRFS